MRPLTLIKWDRLADAIAALLTLIVVIVAMLIVRPKIPDDVDGEW